MRRSTSSTVWIRLAGSAFLIASVGCLVLAPPAGAGIGNPLKKAKEKLEKAAESKADPDEPAGEPVVFDELVVELTDVRLDGIVAAFRKAGEVSAGRPALIEKLNKLNDERSKHMDKHWEAMQALQLRRSDVEACYHDGYEAAQDRRTEEYREKALTDPAIREKFTRVAQENNAAAARGDSAAIQRIQAVLLAETLPTRDDSLEVRKSCGPIPPRSADEDRLDALDKEIASLEEQIRRIDEKVAEAQAERGGLNREQWGMALERIQMYLVATRSSKSSSSTRSLRGFSDDELKALEKHLEQLRAALG